MPGLEATEIQAALRGQAQLELLLDQPQRPGPSALELDLDGPPPWWRLLRTRARRAARERVAASELQAGTIDWSTYRRVTPWLWEAPDPDAVW